MPLMNRIRVNNVKYNFGTQQYDDFTMRFHGKNTIYDLANGGGKSVLMLLLLQNLIPNCTLDEKQPVEKLFRTSGGSKTIHSMIEWVLDEPDVEDGYQYMTTGFCARKAKENDGNATAAIDYFNYCIFYRAYNDNDIVNLPLEKDGEKITYVELRNYIKDLERLDPGLNVFLFERKGEYQHFISGYGLHESAWEIVRGINKTEGHVRTYFETNYKTTRKVIEDLLIEEIIEKSFRNKIQKDDMEDNMAKTLLEIKDKLVELSRKKQENAGFEHQKELILVLSNRVETLRALYEEKEGISSQLRSVYVMLKEQVKEEERYLKKFELQKEEIMGQKNQAVSQMKSLKIMKEKNYLEKESQLCNKLELDNQNMKIEIAKVEQDYKVKESINDYLEYKDCEKQKIEAESDISKSDKKSEDFLERLYDYAAVKKAFLEERVGDSRKKGEEASAVAKNLRIEAKAKIKAKQELECEEAVAKSNVERLKIEQSTVLEQLKEARKSTNLLLIEDVDQELKKNLDEKNHRLKEQGYLERDIQKKGEEVLVARQESLLLEKQLEEANARRREQELEEKEQGTAEGKYNKLSQVYQADSLAVLKKHILDRYEQMVARSQEMLAQETSMRQNGEAVLKGAPFYEGESLIKVKEYLSNRHDMVVYTGQEYLKNQLPDRSELLLRECPILPYSLVIKGKKNALSVDPQLKKLELGEHMVPIICEEYLISDDGALLPKDMVEFVGHDSAIYMQEEMSANYGENLIKEADKLATQRKENEENQSIYLNDYEFVMEYGRIEEKEVPSLSNQLVELNKQQKEAKEKENTLQSAWEKLQEKRQKTNQRLEELTSETEMLQRVKRHNDTRTQVSKALKEWTERLDQITLRLQESVNIIEESTRKMKEAEALANAIAHRLEEETVIWRDVYAAYDQDRKPLKLGFTEAQLDAEFKSMKKIVEKGKISLEDKYAMIKTLARTMERLKNQIEKRGVSMQDLEDKWKKNELYLISENELINLSRDNNRRQTQRDQLENEIGLAKAECNKSQGRIELGMKELEEAGISFVSMDLEDDELANSMDEVKNQLQILTNKTADLSKEEKKRQKQYGEKLDSFKDIKRMMDIYQLGLSSDQAPAQREYSYEELKECMHRFDRGVRKENKAREELNRYKTHTAQAMRNLNAFELADVIEKDLQMPETLGEMEELRNSLNDMVQFIELEQSRIEKGIQDMEFIKLNFENQCIRRCQDVKTELDRLPKLSKIILDGETIQMIGLAIPYIKEEQYSGKMSDYIDGIVMKSDQYEDPTERIKYIRTQLSLKNLFSVIVTDMNEIKLTLYKRERMKEQSRYLRYEEAVGSTGQSQGIYIQFLVSIINYISNISSRSGDDNELGKVIFIDNPFGAAKDVYIWEPIFELLKTNHVQLIVPARGATPAITGRFDVNYILGQKLVNGKQQTVVADYRSQVEVQDMEYHKLDFAQESFDFV